MTRGIVRILITKISVSLHYNLVILQIRALQCPGGGGPCYVSINIKCKGLISSRALQNVGKGSALAGIHGHNHLNIH